MARPTISAVIICFNEEKNIGRCLESIKDLVDEIVLVDSGSVDQTRSIADEYGVKWIHQPFLGYIEQKNFALAQAKNDLILSLDADESLSPVLRKSILNLSDDRTIQAASMSRMTYYCGAWIRHGAWYPDIKTRLFDRRVARWGGINPHDRIEVTEAVNTIRLKGDILHYSYYSIADHISQSDRFTRILAEQMHARGKRSSLWRITLKPPYRFFTDYILKRGFLDGYSGFVIAIMSAHAVFLREVRLRELDRKNG